MSKTVANIMKRVFLGDSNYIFYVTNTTFGDYDPEYGIFTDRNGNEYASMTNPNLLISEVDTAFGNLEDINVIKEKLGMPSIKEAISEYNYVCSRYIYYVSLLEDNSSFYIPICLEDMRDSVKNMFHEIEKSGGFEKVAEETKKRKHSPVKIDDEENDDISDVGRALLSDEFRSELASVIMEMIDGVYSLDELKLIKEQLELQKEDLESTIDSVDLQIEATEAGTSFTKLKDEEKIVRVDGKPKVIKMPIKNYINLEELYKKVTKTLIAQDEPTRRVITEIARKEQNPKSKNRALLITGQTGSGKTKMMELIAKYLDRPFYKVDSTQLTIPGYVGKDLEEVLWDLYIQCDRDKDKAEHAIIFFDEIDKKGSSRKDDVSGKGVLNVLLPFIEGAEYNAVYDTKRAGESVKIDSSNMIVILGGAFTDVYNDLKESNSIGFGADMTKKDKSREARTEDFIEKAKMPDEFMGRVSIIKLNDLDEDAIKRIILESDESAVKMQEALFDQLGVKLTLGDDYISEIARRAVQRKTGARGLNTVVDESTWEAYADAYSHIGQIDEIILGKETVEDPKNYKKVLKKK